MFKLVSVRRRVQIALASMAAASGSAFADMPSGVQTALDSAGSDAKAVAVAVFVVLVGIFAIKLMRRGL